MRTAPNSVVIWCTVHSMVFNISMSWFSLGLFTYVQFNTNKSHQRLSHKRSAQWRGTSIKTQLIFLFVGFGHVSWIESVHYMPSHKMNSKYNVMNYQHMVLSVFFLPTSCTNSLFQYIHYIPLHVSSTIVLIFSRSIVLTQHLVSSPWKQVSGLTY